MSKLIIHGGEKLKGEIEIEGAKNAVLPILAASVLNCGENIIKNCPLLKDVETMTSILKTIGCKVKMGGREIIVDSSGVNRFDIPEGLVREMRSSIILTGAMLSRYNKVTICYPGGCEIGPRPIDLHIKGLRALGAKVSESHGYIICESEGLTGGDIHLDYPSVGATENIMLASVMVKGTTYIRNAAKEPEIADLQNYLNGMGARITGAGSNVIRIEGVKKLTGVEHEIIPDRIVAGTYMIAAAITGGNVTISKVIPEHLNSVIANLRDSGCKIDAGKNHVNVTGPLCPKAVDIIRTLPYPGFPTDMQPQMGAYLSIAKGTSIITETVFENRFKYIEELTRMGANIKVEGRLAIIKGVKGLTGAQVYAFDLRGGAALVLAGLAADNETVIVNIKHIDRGYERIEDKLSSLGAKVERIEELDA